MLYIFYGLEEFIIKKKIEALAKANDFIKEDVVSMDFTSTSLSKTIEETQQSNLFSAKTFVIADNFEKFLTKTQPNKERQIEKLIDFSGNKTDSILILICNKDEIPKNNFENKLQKYTKIIECKKMTMADKRRVVAKAFENRGVEITPQLIDHFIKRSAMTIRGLINEVDKIALTNTRVNQESIDQLVDPKVEDNIFSLVDSILDKNYEASIIKYNDLVRSGTSPLAILTLVGNEVAVMNAIIEGDFWKASSSEIALMFKKPAFVISKAKKKMVKYNKSEIMNLNQKISELEFEFKTGKISQNIFIELFILQLMKGQ